MTSRSATIPAGAGQVRVILNPSFVMAAPKAAYPSIDAAVQTWT